ncbi:hypothetical protein K435DRAFT_821259 [Dendrothele bispora CBS 962.96]|uniref:Uncharacterized protein n=1 Tax=Dendrothele bispora (strain CBS 962.96) TaxID=1314807 RepID=A0A4S8LKY1_DENBC|nr:hypothetical protein K435DRAFT_821259 [Dendrothele bispora CBS 962.96]
MEMMTRRLWNLKKLRNRCSSCKPTLLSRPYPRSANKPRSSANRPRSSTTNPHSSPADVRPWSSGWDALVQGGVQEIAQVREELTFTCKQTEHSRGDFPAVTVGAAHRGGRKEPGNIWQSNPAALAVLTTLLAMHFFQSLAGFANCIFKAYLFHTYQYYSKCLDGIYSWKPDLQCHYFKTSVFGTCTVNFGPRMASRPHRDSANLAFGWCAITALGNFNPNKGGHLILWDLGLALRFSPGSTILIPSTLIKHSNIPIQNRETQYSFVQYSAAGLF